MKPSQPAHPVSVDSETGLYWNGQQVLRRKALVRETIDRLLPEKREFPWLKMARAAHNRAAPPPA